jgi:hypothetical protein
MRKIFILLAFCFSFTLTQSQTLIVFKTFDDFLNNKGEKHEDLTYKGVNTGPSFRVLVFKGTFGKFRLSQKGNWGFLYKGQLYRFDKKKRDPLWVGIAGKNIIYYENGYGHLNETGFCQAGYFYYLSLDLNSNPFVFPNRRHLYQEVMLMNPACIPLFKCLDIKNSNIKKCVEEFEKIKCGTQFKQTSN